MNRKTSRAAIAACALALIAALSMLVSFAREGRIEAASETSFMRLKDDVVIGITAEGEGSRVDMRSVSRFGQSDLGVNANRITKFLRDLSAS